MKKVLILGAGLVSKPMVEYLLEREITITIASPMKERADEMIAGNPSGSSVYWTMDDHSMLDSLIKDHDLTVSLLPYKFHSDVAAICLNYVKPLVTTSYVQPAIKEMDEEARRKGVLLLNEIGLDPGIDHMSAMKIIDAVHSKGGRIEEFYSLCGALPAPEAADNPFGYKFSWSPKGVVLASRNSALYLKKGRRIYIEPADLFRDTFIYSFKGVGDFEVYPNRDSISYADIYRIPEASTVYRGTFRFKNWCSVLDAMKQLNMLDDVINDYSEMSFADFLSERTGSTETELKKDISLKLGISEDDEIIKAFGWLGLFSNDIMNYNRTSPFEIVSDLMIEKMPLGTNERDMVAMQHLFLASYPDGKKEVIRSSMLDFGTPATNTAIARTVALPAAIAVRLILEGKIKASGVMRPVIPEIYNPVLDELAELGIEMKEEWGLAEEEMIS